MLQKEDPSLANLKVGAGELQETHYYLSDGLLYRQWIPRGCNKELAENQLTLPTQCLKAVLQLAHEVPIAGHLGKHKTSKRILRRFYWPTLYKDVEDFCRSCQMCQRFSNQKVVKIFAQVAIPEEMLTVQGSNFTSQLVSESTSCYMYTPYGHLPIIPRQTV